MSLRGWTYTSFPSLAQPSGSRAEANGGAPSVLIAYGDDDRDILAEAPIDGWMMAANPKNAEAAKELLYHFGTADAQEAFLTVNPSVIGAAGVNGSAVK